MFRRRIGLWMLPVLLLLALAFPAQAFQYSPAEPQGTIGISRPAISQRFQLGTGERFGKVTLLLDGKAVTPQVDQATGEVRYTPPAALAPGVHQVKLTVEVIPADTHYYYQPLASTFSFTVSGSAVSSLPGPDGPAMAALARVNSYRSAAGLPFMTYNNALGAAAGAHTAWMDQNRIYAHEEQPGTPGFTGIKPWDRATFYGYTGGGLSEIIHEISDPKLAVDDWMATIYHRTAILAPGNTEMGFGHTGRYSDIDAGPGSGGGGMIAWPYAGMTVVPTQWDQGESPDPLRLYPSVSLPVGPVITLTFAGHPQTLTLTTAQLTRPDGSTVPVMSFAPTNDDHLDDTVSIIPRAPLAANTAYRVRLAGAVDGKPYDKSWSFTTGARGSEGMTPSFEDIGAHWAEPAIRRLVLAGIVAGYPDGSFKPADPLTRAAFVKMLVAAKGLPLTPGQTGGLTDVAGHWAAAQGYLGAAVTAGIIVPAEYPNKALAPDQPISREEIAVMVVRAMGLNAQAAARQVSVLGGRLAVAGHTFTDAGLWGRPGYVAVAVEQGIVTGYAEADGTYTFRPANRANRAEAAVMLTRMLDR